MLPIHRAQSSVFNYDEIPAGYYFRAMNEGGAVQRFWHREKFLSVCRKVEPHEVVLDLGCGPGSFLDVLSEFRGKNATPAYGADIASGQLDFAATEIPKRHPDGKFEFLRLNPNKVAIPLPDESVDLVASIEVIEHIHPYLAAQLLSEARRVLKSKGRLIVTTPNYRSFWPVIEFALEHLSPVKYHEQHISKFTPNSLVKFLEVVGFQVSRLETLFGIAPFLSPLTNWGAHRMMDIEIAFDRKLDVHGGCLLMAECKKWSPAT